jgi:hypothetical protein
MRELFLYWWFRPARWWQFWWPGSGLPGGFIFAAVALAILGTIFR